MLKELVIATKNPDKRKELTRLLKGVKIKVISLEDYPECPEVKEGARCFRENAVRKAMMVSRFLQKPALADDSGLEVDALGGRPGVCSARFAGRDCSYADNNQKLLRLLKNKKLQERGAQFRCVAAFCVYPDIIGVVEGKIRGRIAESPQGKNGFGYDPVFIIPRYKKTFAQLSPRLKNEISHRSRALKKAKKLIRGYFRGEKP
ncbi:MAG: XTP/dITP diphosphatase [Candidatus Omnitrophota bacterium]